MNYPAPHTGKPCDLLHWEMITKEAQRDEQSTAQYQPPPPAYSTNTSPPHSAKVVLLYQDYVRFLAAPTGIQGEKPVPIEVFNEAYVYISTTTLQVRLSDADLSPLNLKNTAHVTPQLFALPRNCNTEDIIDALKAAKLLPANMQLETAQKSLTFYRLRDTAKPGSTIVCLCTLPNTPTSILWIYILLEKFITLPSGKLIGIRLTKLITTPTEAKLQDLNVHDKKTSKGSHHLCHGIAMSAMGINELSEYLWLMQSHHEQGILLLSLCWEQCVWSGSFSDRKSEYNIPYNTTVYSIQRKRWHSLKSPVDQPFESREEREEGRVRSEE